MKSSDVEKAYNEQIKTSVSLLLNDSSLSDVTFSSNNWQLASHQLLVSAASPQLLSVFLSEAKDKVELPANITKRALSNVLKFVYTEKAVVVQNDTEFLLELVDLCHFFKVTSLFSYYLNQLAEELSATNIPQLIELTHLFEDDHTQDIILHLSHQLCNVHLRWDFQVLHVNDLKLILHHFNNSKTSVDEITVAVVSWIANDPSREKYLIELMKYSDLSLMSTDCLVSLIEDDGVIKRNEEISRLLKQELQKRKGKLKDTALDMDTGKNFYYFYKDKESGLVASYNINSDEWSDPRKLPLDLLTDASVVACGQHVYFVGGYKTEIQSSNAVLNYCPMLNRLVSTGRLYFPVFSSSAGSIRGSVYVVDGLEWQRDAKLGCRVQRYNPVTGNCSEVAATNSHHSRSLMHTYNDFMYIAGFFVSERSIERYDPCQDQWTVITSIDTALGCYPATFSGSKLLITRKFLAHGFSMYDILLDKWTIRKKDQGPKKIDELWSITKHGKPLALVLTETRRLYAFDMESEVFQEVKTPPISMNCCYGTAVPMTHLCQQPPMTPTYSVLQTLESMWKNGQRTDVTIVCMDKSFEAHSLLLCIASRYFRSMFASGFVEASTKNISLPRIRGEVFNIVLTFIYSGRVDDVELEFDILVELLEAAHLMEICLLFDLCLQKLVDKLSLENFQELLYLAELYDVGNLECRIYCFLAHNFSHFTEQLEFFYLTSEQLRRLLMYPQLLNMFSIKLIFETVIQWIKFHPNRIDNLKDFSSMTDHVSTELIADTIDQLATEKNPSLKDVLTETLSKLVKSKDSKAFCTESILFCLGRTAYGVEETQLKKYRLASMDWSPPVLSPFSPLYGSTLVVLGNCIYFFGGSPTGMQFTHVTNQVHKYCPSTNTVTHLENLRHAVRSSAATIAYDSIFIVGGENAEGHSLQIVQQYLPFNGTCKEIAGTNYCHKNPAVYFLDDYLIVYSTGYQASNHYERYDFLADQWTIVTSLPTPIPREHLSINYDEKIYMFLNGKQIKIAESFTQFVRRDTNLNLIFNV